MKVEGVISAIDMSSTKAGRVQYKSYTTMPAFVYITFEQSPDWARIGDRIIVEVTNVDAESRRQRGE